MTRPMIARQGDERRPAARATGAGAAGRRHAQPAPAAALLDLQRMAGNAAVARLVQRQRGRGRRRRAELDPPPLARGPWITEIEVNLSGTQRLTATLSDGSQRSRVVSSGKGRCGTAGPPCADAAPDHDGDQCTPPGSFRVQSRRGRDFANREGDAMAYYVGFLDNRGIGIHNSQPANGRPRSHGCVRVGTDGDGGMAFARWLNERVRIGRTSVTVTGVAAARRYRCPRGRP